VSKQARADQSNAQAVRPPYVAAAFLCERLLQEKADDTLSAIRIIDRFQLNGTVQIVDDPGVDVADVDLPVLLRFVIVVSLTTFPRLGRQTITLQPFGPDGIPLGDENPVDLTVSGGIAGATLRMEAEILVAHSGPHWFSVRYRGRELTRTCSRLTITECARESIQVQCQRPKQWSM
jgi:hypothetical protein